MSTVVDFVLSPAAITYGCQQLLQRAGWQQADFPDGLLSPSAIYYGDPHQWQGTGPAIIIAACHPTAGQRLLAKSPNSLHWIPFDNLLPTGFTDHRFPFAPTLPVLFWGDGFEGGQKPFVERWADGTVIFYADILAATIFLLTRWEETVLPDRDRHERFPATKSVASQQGFLDRPLVDEYAQILQAWLTVLFPRWQPQSSHFIVKLSHDIDWISHFRTASQGLSHLGGDLVKRRNLCLARATTARLFRDVFQPAQTTQLKNLRLLADISKQHGLSSSFYFMASEPTMFDSGYNPASQVVQECIRELQYQGHEIGLHPSYDTLHNPVRLAQEKVLLDRVIGYSNYGGRQHYLRFCTPDTWRHWAEVGLTYDSTMGFAEQEGFRCGTSHPFQPFDIVADKPLPIVEMPLIAMDVTLQEYRQFSPDAAKRRILQLAERCHAVHGQFTLLWHNSSRVANQAAWWQMYRESVAQLAAL